MTWVAAAIGGAAVLGAGATVYASGQASSAAAGAANSASQSQAAALGQQAALAAPYTGMGQAAIPLYEQLLGINPTASKLQTVNVAPSSAGGWGYWGASIDPATGTVNLSQPNQAQAQTALTNYLQTGKMDTTGLSEKQIKDMSNIVQQIDALKAQGYQFDPNTKQGTINGQSGATGATGANSQGITDTVRNLPGYQFNQQQGQQQTLAGAASMGMGLSGNTLTALDQFNTGLADSYYQQYLGDVQGAVGMGQAAAAGQAANVGNAANNQSNIAMTSGANQASIGMNTVAGLSNILGNAANSYVTSQTLKGLNSGADPYSQATNATVGGP